MSDSLKATVIDIDCVLTISAKLELDDELELDPDELEPPPRLPALALPPAPEPEADEPLDPELAPALVEPLEIVSPGTELDSETSVPLTGANSFVLLTAISAVRRLASALSTLAWAEAIEAALDSAVEAEFVVVPDPFVDPEPPAGLEPFVDPEPVRPLTEGAALVVVCATGGEMVWVVVAVRVVVLGGFGPGVGVAELLVVVVVVVAVRATMRVSATNWAPLPVVVPVAFDVVPELFDADAEAAAAFDLAALS